jgi:hypothetical protein
MSEISEKEYRDARKIVFLQSDKIEKLEKENEKLKAALETIADARTCEELTNGLHEKYNNYQDGWFGVIEYASKALKEVKE